jgi:hypothetical protein
MKPLLLLIITIVFSSNVYAEPEELDREKYAYHCVEKRLNNIHKGTTACRNLKKGDILESIYPNSALLYCDTELPIMGGEITAIGEEPRYTCFYNGKPIKRQRQL